MVLDGVQWAISEGRRTAEALMVDSCTIVRPGDPVTDPNTGGVTPPATVVYTGKAKVQPYEPYERNPEVAGAVMTVQRYAVHIPVGSYEPKIGDVVEVTAAMFDPQMVGNTFRVAALLHKSMSTAYRLAVEELVSDD
jgi:hypothetical protein